MKKVFMSIAVLAIMTAAVSCQCNNSKKAEEPAAAEECAGECNECEGECNECEGEECTKACCDSTAAECAEAPAEAAEAAE